MILVRWRRIILAGSALAACMILIVAVWQVGVRSDSKGSHSLPDLASLQAGTPYRSYEFEARVTWGSTSQGPDEQALIIRGWYEAPARTRWDIVSADPRYKDMARVL